MWKVTVQVQPAMLSRMEILRNRLYFVLQRNNNFRSVTICLSKPSVYPGHVSNANPPPPPENESVNLHFPHRNCIFIFNHGQNRDNCQQAAITCDFECTSNRGLRPLFMFPPRARALPLAHTKFNLFRPTSRHCA